MENNIVDKTKLELVEIDKNHFTFKGYVKLFDGTICYTDEFKEYSWYDNEIKIDCLDLSFKIRDSNNLSNILSNIYSRNKYSHYLSGDSLASLYQILFYEKKLDDRILNIECGRNQSRGIYSEINYIEDTPTVPINILRYASSSAVTIYVSIDAFLNIIKNNKLEKYEHECYVRIFNSAYNIDIQTISTEDFLEKLSYIRKYNKSKYNTSFDEKYKLNLANEYFSRFKPNHKEGNFIIDFRGDIYLITLAIVNINPYDNKRNIGNSIENDFDILFKGHKVINNGLSKKTSGIIYSPNNKFICSEDEYKLLKKDYPHFPDCPNKSYLMKIYSLKNKPQQYK